MPGGSLLACLRFHCLPCHHFDILFINVVLPHLCFTLGFASAHCIEAFLQTWMLQPLLPNCVSAASFCILACLIVAVHKWEGTLAIFVVLPFPSLPNHPAYFQVWLISHYLQKLRAQPIGRRLFFWGSVNSLPDGNSSKAESSDGRSNSTF